LLLIGIEDSLGSFCSGKGGIVSSSVHSVASAVQSDGELSVVSPFANSSISFCACSEDDLNWFTLHPLEEHALGEAVSQKRRRDFLVGRAAARRALEKVGFPVVTPVLRGEHREPLWPVGVVGSISHSSGVGIAAVAWQQDVPAIGIDIQEVEERYTDELIARFADPDEFDWVRSDPARRTERAVKLFSAKESVFKALYPLRKVWFAFDVARLTPTESENHFKVAVRLPALSSGIIHLDVGIVHYSKFVVSGAVLSQPLPPFTK
jgi:4'-phosphopantetheinyl transferase EntD